MGTGKGFFHSKLYQNSAAKLYGIGASVVILGALFKIQHYPGAGLMLGIGLGVEAVIFFVSAFEPPHVMPDWSLVYPELWGIYHPDEPHPAGYELDSGTGIPVIKKTPTEELDKMLEEAKIGPELIASLGDGLRKLSDNTGKLANLTNAADATNAFVSNLSRASESVQKLNTVYEKTGEAMAANAGVSEELTTSVKNMVKNANQAGETFSLISGTLRKDMQATDEYINSIKTATQTLQVLADKYTLSADALGKSAQAFDFSQVDSSQYGEQIKKITQNISALNAVYELQLQGANKQIEKVQQMQASVDAFVNNINASAESVSKYKEQADVMAGNLAALNTVYGNMLTAMNIKINK